MSKFQVGDTVRVLRIKDSEHYDRLYSRLMWDIIGQKFTVVHVESDGVCDLDDWLMHEDDLERVDNMPVMPETFRTMVETDDTHNAMFDLLEIAAFRTMLRENGGVVVSDGIDADELFYLGITLNLGRSQRMDLQRFICDKMGWESAETLAKRSRLEDLKRQVAALEAELS